LSLYIERGVKKSLEKKKLLIGQVLTKTNIDIPSATSSKKKKFDIHDLSFYYVGKIKLESKIK